MNSVLLVEDDPIIAQIYKRKLASEGFEVVHVGDGELAIEHFAENSPDIVLLDLQLPKKNGIDVLQFIRGTEIIKDTPVVVFTNSYLGSLVQTAWKAGANKCLTKAVCTPKQVADVLHACIAGDEAKAAASEKAKLAEAPPPDIPAVQISSDEEEDTIKIDPSLFQTPAQDSSSATEPPAATDADSNAPISMAGLEMPAPPTPAPAPPPAPTQPSVPAPAPASPRRPRAPRTMRMPSHTQVFQKPVETPAPPAAERAAEAEYTADLRKDFVATLPPALAYLRQKLQEFNKNESDTSSLRWADDRSSILFDMYRKMHSISAGAGASNCVQIARIALAFEALLTEMSEDQDKINASSIRTVTQTVDFLATLFEHAGEPDSVNFAAVDILVVDDEPISRRAVMRGLELAQLKGKDVADPMVAAELATADRFDLIFLDIDMPGMDGYELCKKIRETETNARTPVIFVTGLTDFMSRAKSSLSGGNDLIGKPFLPVELSVKALVYLVKAQFDKAAGA